MNHGWLGTAWRWVRWPLLVLVAGYVILVGVRVKYMFDQDKVAADVAAIHADKLTHDDVYGALPPVPDGAANNKTLAGVDANNNGIRDDVEIAIYNAHKDSAKTSAAMFQYAKELQMEFTRVYNSETLVAVIQEEDRGFGCVFDLSSSKDLTARNKAASSYVGYVKDLVFDTEQRKNWQENVREKYETSYSLPNTESCDLAL